MFRSKSLVQFSTLVIIGMSFLSGCISNQRHSSLVSPGPPRIERDFDFEQMARYQADLNAYAEAIEGNVAAASAAAAAGAPCPTSTGAGATPTQLAFCTQNGKLVVEVRDSGGSLVSGAATSISISSTPLGLTGVTTVTATGGVATFDQLYLNSPGTYVLTATGAGLNPAVSSTFTVAINLDRAKYFRNKIVDRFAGDIDHVYGEYTNSLYAGKGVEAVTGDIVSLGLTAASAITLVTRTKTILAALATGVTGVSLSIDKNLFGQQTFAALAIAMQARRDEARSSIVKNEQLAVTDYTLEAARRDLVSYFYSGTLPGAIQEIQQEAATKSAAVTGTGTAAKLAFTQAPNGSAGMPLEVEVQVQDSNGNVVTSATNAITISSSPTGVTGTLTSNAVAGVATFSLTFPNQGTYTLTAAGSGFSSATNGPITIGAAGSVVPPRAMIATPSPARSAAGLH
jgi:hypothetical protein